MPRTPKTALRAAIVVAVMAVLPMLAAGAPTASAATATAACANKYCSKDLPGVPSCRSRSGYRAIARSPPRLPPQRALLRPPGRPPLRAVPVHRPPGRLVREPVQVVGRQRPRLHRPLPVRPPAVVTHAVPRQVAQEPALRRPRRHVGVEARRPAQLVLLLSGTSAEPACRRLRPVLGRYGP